MVVNKKQNIKKWLLTAWYRQPISHCWPQGWLQPSGSSWQCPVLQCWAWRPGNKVALPLPQADLLSHCLHGQHHQLNTQIPLEESTDAESSGWWVQPAVTTGSGDDNLSTHTDLQY